MKIMILNSRPNRLGVGGQRMTDTFSLHAFNLGLTVDTRLYFLSTFTRIIKKGKEKN